MSRLIDADALERDGWSLQRTYRKDKETMVYEVKAISEIPTAQPEPSQMARDIAAIIENEQDMRIVLSQPEIIRCKDCKYMTEHYDTDGNAPYWTCSEWDSGTDYDGFCHYAERRTDEQIW